MARDGDSPTAAQRALLPQATTTLTAHDAATAVVATARQAMPLPPSLAHLAALVAARRSACDAVDAEVLALRARGTAWPLIAVGLGVSRQAVRQRYGAAAAQTAGTSRDSSSATRPSPQATATVAATDEMTDSATLETTPDHLNHDNPSERHAQEGRS